MDERLDESSSLGMQRLLAWFAGKGWTPFDFQKQTWNAYLAGRSGLVHAPTGFGKTLAVFGGPLAEALNSPAHYSGRGAGGRVLRGQPQNSPPPCPPPGVPGGGVARSKRRGLTDSFTVIWLTPMRALANDTAHTLARTCLELELPWSVELRTSDTSSSVRKRQRDRLPTILVTTPESLSLLLSYPDSREKMSTLRCAIVDEWHELLATKRGVQTELGLARLRAWNPSIRTWGLSATLENLEEAMGVLLPRPVLREGGRGEGSSSATSTAQPPSPLPPSRSTRRGSDGVLIHAHLEKQLNITSAIPETIENFPWGGHMGLRMVPAVIAAVESAESSLIFTNTRAQSEIWFKTLLSRKPEWLGNIAIHHGSLDRAVRLKVESMLREGKLRAVVCTSSLDLGVDFPAVDQVIQVGSPKGIARLMQRAGRSGHRPGQMSRVICVPTHAFELMEFSAAREGIAKKSLEPRLPLLKPLDVLAQHIVTVAAGGGFEESSLLDEVRSTHSYSQITDDEWRWTMDFVIRGGQSLTAYPRFARIKNEANQWIVASTTIAKMHRLSIGTIAGDAMMIVALTNGKKLGTIEETFIGKLKPGDFFTFAGRPLELVRVREMTAHVRPSKSKKGAIPSWAGGRFPMSTQLARGVRARLEQARNGELVDDEMRAIAPLLKVQARWSAVPAPHELLLESFRSREGGHWFIHSFLGRLVHEGLGAVIAHRLHRTHQTPITATFTDYGIELHSPAVLELGETDWISLLSPERLLEDLLACLNAGELTKRQFREIARVAGLVIVNSPGAPKSMRQIQASSELFYDVFREFDPDNMLLEQARREVLERQLEFARLRDALTHLGAQSIIIKQPKRFTPMAFPIWAQRIGSQTVRAESAHDRIERMLRVLEKASEDENSTD